eukprot:12502760-Ditylum_brightwellii.AAC.1
MVFSCARAFKCDEGYHDNLTPHASINGETNILDFKEDAACGDDKESKRRVDCQVTVNNNETHYDMIYPSASVLYGDAVYHGNLTSHASINGETNILDFKGEVGDADNKESKRGVDCQVTSRYHGNRKHHCIINCTTGILQNWEELMIIGKTKKAKLSQHVE